MNKYIRVKFSKIDFLNFRFSGPGLGNMLFVWARAIVYAERFNYILLNPNWATFKIGTLLRNEKDKRFYKNIFINSGIKGYKKYKIQFLSFKIFQKPFVRSILNVPEVIIFSGLKNQMNDIIDDHKLIKLKLTKILSSDVIEFLNQNKPSSVGVHIRLGDFQKVKVEHLRSGKTNTRIPIGWYISQINKLKQSFGDKIDINIFSDGSKDELKEVLSINNVRLVEGGNAIADLLLLSKSKIIISSNSTFSLWASYLGRCHTIWYPGTKRFTLFNQNESCLEIELDYDQKLPSKIKI